MKIVGNLALSGKEYSVSDEGLSFEKIKSENPHLDVIEVEQVFQLTRKLNHEEPNPED